MTGGVLTCTVASSHSIVKIQTNNKTIINFLKEDVRPKYIIPSFEFIKKHTGKHDFIVNFLIKNRFDFKIDLKVGRYIISEKYYDDIGFDLIFVLHQLFSYINETKNIYTFHSSSVKRRKNGILIVGGTGAGKTTISLLLSRMGFNLFSNDSSHVISRNNNFYIIGGNKAVKINIFNPYIKKLKIEKYKLFRDNIFFETPNKKQKAKIKAIVLPYLNDKISKILEAKYEKSIIKLFESTSKIIRGVGLTINNFSYPLPSLDSERLSMKRINFIRRLVKRVKIFECHGKSIEIAKMISENIL